MHRIPQPTITHCAVCGKIKSGVFWIAIPQGEEHKWFVNVVGVHQQKNNLVYGSLEHGQQRKKV